MNALIAQMTGHPVQEDVPVPVAAKARPRYPRSRASRDLQRRTASAMMGMAEAEENIIPKDAEEIDNYGGPAGYKVDRERVEQDKEPEPSDTPDDAYEEGDDGQLISPKAALVAPDVTPHTLEPIDPSDVPPAQVPPSQTQSPRSGQTVINPLDVLLGRSKPASSPMPEEAPVTAESAQASVNATLGVNAPADLLGRGKEMPPPAQGDSKKILEAFYRFARP